MSRPSHAAQMVERLECLALECAGLSSVTTGDGQTVTWADIQGQLQFYKRQLAIEQRKIRRVRYIPINRMGGLR